MTLLLLLACVEKAPMPDPGDCTTTPQGTYEYGQIEIGRCLAGPSDLALLAGDTVLAVSNANPWKDFTGGSALFLDIAAIDESVGRNLVSDVALAAVALPSFVGPMAVAEDRELLMVNQRLSADARTREATDSVAFIDYSDPAAPVLADVAESGSALDVGYDPSGILYDGASGLAWVVNRTSHDVSMIDVSADPVAIVPPGGGDRLDADPFLDADADGSRAAFVTLENYEDGDDETSTPVTAHAWSLEWSVGTVRAWIPVEGGARRVTGNGAGTWVESEIPLDLDLADADDDSVAAVLDPAFSLDGGVARLVFSDGTDLRAADAPSTVELWTFEDEALLSPREGGWDAVIGGPHLATDGETWFLFYDGGDGATQSIGVATSGDGATFSREGDSAVVAVDGLSATDPFLVYDTQGDRWRMWFALSDGTIGHAVSDDLLTWEVTDDRFAPASGASAPAVGRWGGRWHLFYASRVDDGAWSIAEATSVDGLSWTDVGTPFAVEGELEPAVALQVAQEDAFTLVDDTGEVFPITLTAGDSVSNAYGGWTVSVAVGFALAGEDFGGEGVEVGSVTGDTLWVTVTPDAGGAWIGRAERAGDTLVADAAPVLSPDDLDVDELGAPVVADVDGGQVMFFSRSVGGVTTIGRATSADGLSWTADADPVLEAGDDWESVELEPGSVVVGDDGTLSLWYAGFDGERWRVGLAESTDGGASFTRVPGETYAWQFDATSPGTWADSGVRHPSVLVDGDVERLWFAGFDGAAWQVGYAERAAGEADFTPSTDVDGEPRAVIEHGNFFGVDHVVRPVAAVSDAGWELWYTGYDEQIGRAGRATLPEPDRAYRDLRLPGLADTWGFTAVPARDEESISLDGQVGDITVTGLGCQALAQDEVRGFLYVGCKLSPWFYVVDIRDDSTETFDDLNYLDLEAAVWVETSTNACSDLTTGQCSGLRALMLDPARGWLWGLADEPEAVYAVDLANIPDDASAELVREQVAAMLPLPRSGERDEGVDTESYVGPAQMALHPDGEHLFVTNFNDNSVSVFDLSLGAAGTLVAEARDLGENPYAIRLNDAGTRAYVAFYAGEVEGKVTQSTLGVFDADPASADFLQPLTWVVNQ